LCSLAKTSFRAMEILSTGTFYGEHDFDCFRSPVAALVFFARE
jgi:hypothetical protein